MLRSILITGGSGVGKSSIYNMLRRIYPCEPSPPWQSRPKRDDEVAGIDANFVDDMTFEKMFVDGAFLEKSLHEARYLGSYYGSPRPWLDQIASGKVIVGHAPKVPAVRRLCDLLAISDLRSQLLWVNLYASDDIRMSRISPRTNDEAELRERVFGGDSYGPEVPADVCIDTDQPFEDIIQRILHEAGCIARRRA